MPDHEHPDDQAPRGAPPKAPEANHTDVIRPEPAPLYSAAARAYLTAGWPSVLPLPHAKKASPPTGYTGRGGAWPTPDQIDQWTTQFPDGNLALRLPEDVIGIDVDAYADKPGARTLTDLEAELGPLPATIISTARTDGISGIRLYRTPARPSWHDPGAGVEIIHSGWRYLVVAPSIHPDGGTYRWIDQDTGEIVQGAPTPARLPELPAAWAERLSSDATNEKATVEHGQVDTWISGLAAGNPCKATRGALDAFHADLRAGGGRHDAMLDATGRLARALERGHQGGPAALTEAHHAFVTAVTGDGTRSPQLAEQEWRRALEGAYALVAASPTPEHDRGCRCHDGPGLPTMPVTTLDPPAAPTGPQDAATAPQEPPASPLEQLRANPDYQALVSQEATRLVARDDARQLVAAQTLEHTALPRLTRLDTFLEQPDPDVTYRIDALWPTDGRCLLAAQYKAGKTTTVGNILRALADGEALFDRFEVAVPDGRIVLIDDELHANTLRRWLREQHIGDTSKIDVVALRGRLSTFNILDQAVRDAWADQIRAAEASVVLLDCLRPIIDALGLNEDKDVGRVLTAFDELLDTAGVSEGLIVHHMGHSGERSRGDSRLRDWPDAEWKIVRQQEEGEDDPAAPRFFSAFGRDVDVPEQQLSLAPDGRRLRIAGGSRREAKTRRVVEAVVRAVERSPGITARDLRKAVVEDVGGQAGQVDKARDQAKLEGLIRVESGLRGARFHHPAVTTLNPSVSTVSDRVQDTVDTVPSECVRVSIEDTDTLATHQTDPPAAEQLDTDTVNPNAPKEVPL